MPGGFLRGSPVFAYLLIGPSHVSWNNLGRDIKLNNNNDNNNNDIIVAFIRLGEAMKNQTRMSGGTVKLKCTVTGYPLPMYTWYKDGEMIHAGFKTVKSGSRCV